MRLLYSSLLLTGVLLAEGGFQPLYNGENFDDWIVDTPSHGPSFGRWTGFFRR